jgi:hypothetical protein
MSALLPRNEEDESPDEGGTDCSFTTDAQYEVATSGSAAECYGSAVLDDGHLQTCVAQPFATDALSQPDR